MTCVIRKQGATAPGTTTVTLERADTTLVFKDVPAQACTNCGEAYLNDAATQRLLTTAEQRAQSGVQFGSINGGSINGTDP